MKLIRSLVFLTMDNSIQFKALHIEGAKNNIADAISRFQMDRFGRLCPTALQIPCVFPPHSEILWN